MNGISKLALRQANYAVTAIKSDRLKSYNVDVDVEEGTKTVSITYKVD